MTQVFRSPLSLQTFSSKKEWFSHAGALLVHLQTIRSRATKWTDWSTLYRLFKLTLQQTNEFRSDLTQMNSWDDVEHWINHNLDILYANPMIWFDDNHAHRKRVIRVEIVGGKTEDLLGCYFDFTDFEVDYSVKGEAYAVTMKVWPEMGNQKRPGRFEMRYFKDAMACFGMVPIDAEEYQPAGSDPRGEHQQAHWEIKFAFMKEHWPNLPRPAPLPGTDEWLEEGAYETWEERKLAEWAEDNLNNDDPNDEVLQSHLRLITE